eukprot:3012496-Rhodomonas_salina.2
MLTSKSARRERSRASMRMLAGFTSPCTTCAWRLTSSEREATCELFSSDLPTTSGCGLEVGRASKRARERRQRQRESSAGRAESAREKREGRAIKQDMQKPIREEKENRRRKQKKKCRRETSNADLKGVYERQRPQHVGQRLPHHPPRRRAASDPTVKLPVRVQRHLEQQLRD